MDAVPDLRMVRPDLHRLRIPGGGAHLLNCYLWSGQHGVTLVDTGWPQSGPLIVEALHRLGRREADVERVVLTHFHDDHAGAAAEIAEWPNAVIVAGAEDAPFVRGVVDGPVPHLTEAEKAIHPEVAAPPHGPACRVDQEVSDGDVLDFGGGAHVVSVPGHTPGSIALHLPDLDLVLTGDAVAEFDGHVILGVFNTDRAEVRRSAQKIAATGAGAAGFGHGEFVDAHASARIRQAADPFA